MKVSAINLAFEKSGKGIPLILLHGYPLNRSIWRGVLPYLNDVAEVFLPDLRGHGESPKPSGEYFMETMAADVVALMDSEGIGRAAIAGHSMGGYVALAVLKKYPERVAALGLVTSQAAADSPERKLARLQSVEDIKISGPSVVTDSMLSRLTRQEMIFPRLKEIMEGASSQGLIGTLLGIANREDARGWLNSIQVPVLVISGGDDQIIPRERAAEIFRLCRSSWWVEFPGCGHVPMLENPEATGIALRSLVICSQTCS